MRAKTQSQKPRAKNQWLPFSDQCHQGSISGNGFAFGILAIAFRSGSRALENAES
jgi:hypothetical protein